MSITLKQAKDNGLISKHAYLATLRAVGYAFDKLNDYGPCGDRWSFEQLRKTVPSREEIEELTIKDIFETVPEEWLLQARGFGVKTLVDLKGLL